jgi:hypothetical protein
MSVLGQWSRGCSGGDRSRRSLRLGDAYEEISANWALPSTGCGSVFLRCDRDPRSSGATTKPPPAWGRSRSPATGRTAAGGGRRTTTASPGPASASSWCRPSRHPFPFRLRPSRRARGQLTLAVNFFQTSSSPAGPGSNIGIDTARSLGGLPRSRDRAAATIVEPRLSITTASDPGLIRLNWLPWNTATFKGFSQERGSRPGNPGART